MSIFGGFPWNRSSFAGGPGLGQVPLILGPSSWGAGAFVPVGPPPPPVDSIPEGAVITANWGRIEKRGGVLSFFPDSDAQDKIEARTGTRPESIVTSVRWCNPTPPFLPTLGGFFDPATGYYCDLNLPEEWSEATRGW